MNRETLSPIVESHQLFPTHLVNLQFSSPEDDEMNRQLVNLIRTEPIYQNKNLADYGNDLNMVDHATQHPCVERVLAMFALAVDHWLRAAGFKGAKRFTSKISLFPSYLTPGQAVSPHYHARTELVGIYYVTCGATDTDGPPLKVCSHAEWYRQDDGPLWLLDPRFNAALTEVSETICAKLFPRAGLLTVFPGYLWHGVGPNRGTDDRYAIAANIGVVDGDETLTSDREFSH
jgi:hypothetical protein